MMLNKDYRLRILLVAFVLFFMYFVVIGRLLDLQILRRDFFVEEARRIHQKRRSVSPFRGEIKDRSGVLLAVTTRMKSIYVNPRVIPESEHRALARALGPILQIPEDRIRDRLKLRYHFPLIRKIPKEDADRVIAVRRELKLPISSIYLRDESKRLYPNNQLMAPIIGYTAIDDTGDNKGIFGLEMQYNSWIAGNYNNAVASRTALSQFMEPLEQELLDSAYGNRIILTIDASLQYAAEKAVRKALAEWQAESAVAVVQSVKTGEILAMVSLPSFDPNNFSSYDPNLRRNKCISEPFEPGSVQKIITSSILLDMNLVGMDELVDCEHGFAVVDGRRVSDSGGHGMGIVPFPVTFYNSSNIAFSKLALRIDPPVYYQYLKRFGFGEKSGIDLPDESPGILHPLSKWTRLSRTSLAIGYEIGLTPVQTVTAVSAIGNGGKLMKPYVVAEIQDYRGKTIAKTEPEYRGSVVSPQTAEKVRQLMEGVILEGTGKKAAIPGWRAGGKTGTTRLSHTEDLRYIASFAAILPLSDPRYAVYVAISNPKGGYYAAQVASPVYRDIAMQIISAEAIPQDAPIVVAETAKTGDKTVKVPAITAAPTPTPAPETLEIAEGQMPDLRGLTMREVLKRMESVPVRLKFVGSGVVIEQKPEPAAELQDVETCTLVFGAIGSITAEKTGGGGT